MKRFNLMLTDDMHAHIQQNAENRGLTMNAVVIVALEYYFHQHEAIGSMHEMLQLKKQFEAEQLKKPE